MHYSFKFIELVNNKNKNKNKALHGCIFHYYFEKRIQVIIQGNPVLNSPLYPSLLLPPSPSSIPPPPLFNPLFHSPLVFVSHLFLLTHPPSSGRK